MEAQNSQLVHNHICWFMYRKSFDITLVTLVVLYALHFHIVYKGKTFPCDMFLSSWFCLVGAISKGRALLIHIKHT